MGLSSTDNSTIYINDPKIIIQYEKRETCQSHAKGRPSNRPDRQMNGPLAEGVTGGTTFMMNLKANLAIVLISFAPFQTFCAKAMSFDDFARMNNDDEAGYVAFLVEASAQMLKAKGQPDQAGKAISLFNDSSKNGGVQQLASNLKMFYGLNKRNAINPNNRIPAYQFEDAMALTLKDQGIIVPASYLLTAGKDFSPSGPPRQHIFSQ